jgi:putative sigma-54 modulation protein
MTGMDVLIKGKNLEVDGKAQEYIRGKLGKLGRHLPELEEVKVEVTQEMTKAAENRYVVQVTISTHGALLRGEERSSNITAAVDSVVDVLDRQIERFKGRLYRSKRRKASREQVVSGPDEPEEDALEEGERAIVKVKRFPVKPMSPGEAVEHMELLSHDFFIFFNADNDQFSVLYKRDDGDYGLIEPELA